jgi:hypothetical protein
MAAEWPWKVQYWSRSKGFSNVKTRKFRTREAAVRFVSDVQDRGCDTWLFGPGCESGSTWNGSSAF